MTAAGATGRPVRNLTGVGVTGSDPGPALGERLGRLGRGQAALFQGA